MLSLLPLVAPITQAASPAAALWQETQSAAVLAGGLAVHVNHDTLREGESLVISIDVPAGGYLNVVSIGPDGEATVLFPNRYNRDNQVPGGSVVLPTAQMNFDLRASAPFGRTLVAAFLSQEKLDLAAADGKAGLEDVFAHLTPAAREQLSKLGTRSLSVVARATPVMLGGTAEVLTCPLAVPCDSASAGTIDLPDSMVPGIFLDPVARGYEPLQASPRKVYSKGLQLTESSEGFRPRLYSDPVHYCTVGYGHLVKKTPCNGQEPAEFLHGLSPPQGEGLLSRDMELAERAVQGLVKVALTDGQYASLCDFTFNFGARNLQTSTLLKVINQRDFDSVEAQFLRWTSAAGKVLPGLLLRRQREAALFFEGLPAGRGLGGAPVLPPIDIRKGEGGN